MELYIHIPFCQQKCRYCSFTSFPGLESYFNRYTDLLLQEANSRKQVVSEPFTTVYIGGGTPSLLPPEPFSRLINGLRSVFNLENVKEFTAEANPGTITPEWLDTALSCGVNRLSIGMQCFQKKLLHILGRIHVYEDVTASVSAARAAGFENISLDLMFGIPTQTLNDWEETIDAAFMLNPDHISAYGLIPEEGTPISEELKKKSLFLPDPEEEREMYDLVIRKTSLHGFHQYEISNFARETFECTHNIGYWTQVPYLGLGVSAASMTKIRFDSSGMNYERSVNPDSIREYEKNVCSGILADPEKIGPSEARFETLMLGLRMNAGVSSNAFFKMHRKTIESCYGQKLKDLQRRGLVYFENGSWKLTSRGFDIQNSVLVELMDE